MSVCRRLESQYNCDRRGNNDNTFKGFTLRIIGSGYCFTLCENLVWVRDLTTLWHQHVEVATLSS
jgi:hypothetical protein